MLFFLQLVQNTMLNGLIGGVENATIGDRTAKELQIKNKTIVAFPMHEPWLDVGVKEDLIFARNKINKNS